MWTCAWALLAVLLLAFAVVVATWLQPDAPDADVDMPPQPVIPMKGRR